MVVEECSELILAIQKYKRSPTPANHNNLLEEIADVEIATMQARIMYDKDNSVDNWKKSKLDRLKTRLDKE